MTDKSGVTVLSIPPGGNGDVPVKPKSRSCLVNFYRKWIVPPETNVVSKDDVFGAGDDDELKEVGVEEKPNFIPENKLDWWFEYSRVGSTLRREIVGGLTTFFTLAYIMFLNPLVVAGPTGMPKTGSFYATAIATATATMVMGLWVNLPVAIAPGVGLNNFFANACAKNGGFMTWQQGLASVFLSGVLYAVLTVTGFRLALFQAFPANLRKAMGAGIGMFITIIALKISELTQMYLSFPAGDNTIIPFYQWNIKLSSFRGDTTGHVSPSTAHHWAPALSALSILIIGVLQQLEFKAATITTIVICTLIGVGTKTNGTAMNGSMGVSDTSNWYSAANGEGTSWKDIFLPPYEPVAGKLDFSAAGGSGERPVYDNTGNCVTNADGSCQMQKVSAGKFWDFTLSLLFYQLFDSFGTLVAVITRADLMKYPDAKAKIQKGMYVDGFGLMFGAVIGANSLTVYIESVTGILAGARTGIAAVVVGVMFYASCFFLAPFFSIIPNAATVCALVLVGAMSMASLKGIDWEDFKIGYPASLTIFFMAFTFNITNGICAGVIAHVVLYTTQNVKCYFMKTPEKKVKVPWILYFCALIMFFRFVFLSGD